MFTSSARGTAVVAVALAALAVSCTTTSKPDSHGGVPGPPGATSSASDAPGAADASGTSTEPTFSAEKVRDAFAGLQATLGESCTGSDCAYFTGRVYSELQRMDKAMKADPQGPGHFSEPIALIKKLDAGLGRDPSPDDLEKHRTSLVSTRDKINTWMQGHPEDYR